MRVTNRQRLAERKRIHEEGRRRKKYVETRREEKATYQLRETEQLPQTQPRRYDDDGAMSQARDR